MMYLTTALYDGRDISIQAEDLQWLELKWKRSTTNSVKVICTVSAISTATPAAVTLSRSFNAAETLASSSPIAPRAPRTSARPPLIKSLGAWSAPLSRAGWNPSVRRRILTACAASSGAYRVIITRATWTPPCLPCSHLPVYLTLSCFDHPLTRPVPNTVKYSKYCAKKLSTHCAPNCLCAPTE
uniref:Uncharacterized protein n=1 Tax=Cacopsylla melanoneura TaxID=428564 RepID=A0A8D8XSP9_9HEMI